MGRRRASICVVGLAALAGCAAAGTPTARAPQPANATITTTDLLIDSIDGNNVREGILDARTRFEIPPGWHELGLSRHLIRAGMRNVRSTYATTCLDAAAGHTYAARPLVRADGSWTAVVVDTTTNAEIPTTCIRPPQPVVAQDGVADGANPAGGAAGASGSAAPDAIVVSQTVDDDDGPHRPGTGFALRAGWALGGDALIGARLDNGDEVYLDAGAGSTFAASASITPFWPKKRLGFGAGLELGWKYDTIEAANGKATFSRFPLLATVHVLARLSKRWYVRLGAGMEKHLSPHYASDGVFGEAELDLSGRIGPVLEIGLYRLFGRHGGVDAAFRYSRAGYGLGGAVIDGASAGLLLALHYDR